MSLPRSSSARARRCVMSSAGVARSRAGKESGSCLLWKWSFTARAVRLRRAPWHSGQGCPSSATSSASSIPNSRRRAAESSFSASSFASSIQGKMRPWPRQDGHQPRGELKEKCFGSSSGKLSPVSMSVRVVENQLRMVPSGVRRKQEPLPRRRASVRWSVSVFDFRVSVFGCLRSATTTSMSCSI